MPGSHDALDPELAAAFAALPKAPHGALLDYSDIPALRAGFRAAQDRMFATDLSAGADPRVAVEDLRVPRGDGTGLHVALYRPQAAEGALPALLWFHGGGQVMVEDAREDDAYHTGLALALGCVVAAVSYRLAPETPAPGAAEDGYLAFTHLAAHAAEHGIDPRRIGLAGASGGGAPAAATALMARDRAAVRPASLSLLYPMLDDRLDAPSCLEPEAEVVLTRADLRYAWAAVLGDRLGAEEVHPYSAPGRATALGGLPDTFLAVAQYDVLRDEGIDFARRLLAAGVPVDLHLYARTFHAWDRFAPESALTRSFEQTWHAHLRRTLHG
jgi:acetyl esterase/lipase